MDQIHPPSGLLPDISWLPCARDTPFIPRPITVNAIQSRHNDDWFLNLASAMIQQGNSTQGKLFARVYCFMRDFIPGGLKGRRFGHLLGGDIMGYVLNSAKETAPSRHKLTTHIEGAWKELEAWMGDHPDWVTALEAAKTDNRLTPAQLEARRRDPSTAKAPGLVSPAGIVALLAVAHPDHLEKPMKQIDSLKISWMLERRDNLHVKDGFWGGINHCNVETCFRPLSLASADNRDMLVDYSRVFGKEFRRLREDIRPALPEWACNLALESPPAANNNEDQHSDCGRSVETHPEVEEISDPPIDRLRRLFTPTVMTPVLEQLLRERFTGNGVMQYWAQCWSEAARGPDHAIRRSLFCQSASFLINFLDPGDAGFAKPETYMLLDLYDAGLGPSEEGDFRPVLDRLEPFGRCQKALNDLCQAVEWDSEVMITRLTLFAAGVFKNPQLTEYAMNTLRIEELRTRMILQDLPDEPRDMSAFDDTTVRRLGITDWQRRRLLVRSPDEVLTDLQLRLLDDPAAQPPPLGVVDRDASALELLFTDEVNKTHSRDHILPVAESVPHSTEEDVIGILDDFPCTGAEEDCDDFFAGLTAPRELKRAGSHDNLRRKKARLGSVDGGNLIRELHASHDTLRRDLSKMYEDITSKVQEDIEAMYRRVSSDVQSVSAEVAALHSNIKHFSEMQTSMSTAVQESQKISQHIQGAVADAEAEASKSHESLQNMISATQAATHQLIKSEVSALKGPPVPAPGDLNFLAYNCPAPPGWSQKGYEAMAYRAASFYASFLGNPSEGFYGDEEAFKATRAEVPDLPQKHLVAALRHYHSLLYDRPFLRKPEDE